MFKTKFQQIFAAFVIVALIVGSAGAAVSAAPLAQTLSATTVEGTIDGVSGGDFAKIWLGLDTEANGQSTTVTIEWDRFDTEGIGFYLLDETGLKDVFSGSQDVREANLAVSETQRNSPDNVESATFSATGSNYTIVVFNDTPQDASFTLSTNNGVITNDDGSVTDPDAAVADETEAEDDAATTEDGEAATTADAEAADEAATTEDTAVTSTEPVTVTVTTTTTVTPSATGAATTSTAQSSKLEATEVEGELPNQNDQHYLGLRPDERDANITLSLTYNPQDSEELARRLNFWVLDAEGFKRYQQSGDRLSTIAIAAGSTNVDTAANERIANFTASGEGDYTVIVYNSSSVPATYKLVSTNGVLIDDSAQTMTAQKIAASAATTSTATTEAGTTETPVAADSTTPAKPASATASSAAGGTYTVQSGDTLATIARDVYGDFQLYEELCAFNDIDNCDLIEVGDVINLPTAEEIGAESMTAPAAPAATTETTAAATETETEDSEDVTNTEAITGTESITGTSPITATGTTTDTASADEDAGEAEADIVDTLVAAGNYKNLVAALEAAGLVDSLRADGPFTLFAPTDAAFAAFDEAAPGVVQELLVDPTNQLAQILLYHVVSGEYTSADITDNQVLTTLQGEQLTLTVNGDTIGVNSATVSSPDNLATNGVIHGIDNVLLVPTK